MSKAETEHPDAVEAERARLFALLGRLLSAAPDAALLTGLARLRGDAGPLGAALGRLAEAASAARPAAVEREYFALFIGVGRGELQPYASYYLTGFLHERPLAELRASLARLGIARAPGVPEPEDHLAFLCEAYAGLLQARFGRQEDAPGFFHRHLRPWAGRCFADLEGAEAASFYRAVGRLGRIAVEIEQAALELPA
ncbi:TorD/DmsD family molecular chaperone [Siccirubricoccus phaeus]|uniref:TorD/DmsD family molecular chaperone n=1 Tax=Siccirubricoccus phaeus TaxID=2595053 RepID=UPI0011F1A020|nr:molecular chaperone TorD family protein [Siccirubricoccus phaeus]